jgi:hypothetical protein
MLSLLAFAAVLCPVKGDENETVSQESGYVVDKPGTITFTHGLVIVGKVEKPQVMIFLPKEKSYYREMQFDRSFSEQIAQPLPFVPVTE